MAYALLACLYAGLPYPTLMTFDDTMSFAGDQFLQSPADAVFVQGVLFIADELGHQVIRVEGDGVALIAREGKGPGEMANRPVDLEWRNNQLSVYEWNHHVASRFDLKGRYLDRTQPERKVIRLGDRRIKVQSLEERYLLGFRYQMLGVECSFDHFEDRTLVGEHLSRSLLALTEDDRLLLATRRGRFRSVSDDCQETDLFQQPLASYAKEASPTESSYVVYRGKFTKLYRDGLPLIGFAAQSLSKAWALVRHEHNETSHLFELDLAAGQKTFHAPLPFSFDGIRYMQGALILWSSEDALVWVLQVAEELKP